MESCSIMPHLQFWKNVIKKKDFNKVAKTKQEDDPRQDVYNGFINSLEKANIKSKDEAVTYLAHVCWESDGFRRTIEKRCIDNLEKCKIDYGFDRLPNGQELVWYGRGYIQLTHKYNYAAASKYLYPKDSERLLKNPDLVANDSNVAWDVTAYYWSQVVQAELARNNWNMNYATTLEAINGQLEGEKGTDQESRKRRISHCKQVMEMFNRPCNVCEEKDASF